MKNSLFGMLLCLSLLSGTVTQAAQTIPPSPLEGYIDNRSTPELLMVSFVNAINRKEYLRAFSYWDLPGGQRPAQLAPYPDFARGYQNTQSVQLTIGLVTSDAGAGQFHYYVPITFQVLSIDGSSQTFVGCYLILLSSPGAQAQAPFRPMGITAANVKQVSSGIDPISLMSQACGNQGMNPPPTSTQLPTPIPSASDPSVYRDDRSGPVEVLTSLFNAINRHEYLRAYSYWEPNSPQLPSLEQFQQGYQNTENIQLIAGTPVQDVGAGQFYFTVPAAVTATNNGAPQTFIGCYHLHLANPLIQDTPPYQPLGISSGALTKVANDANAAALMTTACGRG